MEPFAAKSFANKRVAVFGLARSGLACLRALVAGGADAFGWDDSPEARGHALCRGLPVEDLTIQDFSVLDALVLAPGVPLTHPKPHWTVERADEAGTDIIGDTEIFMRELAGSGSTSICITGTNGKSTTAALVGHVLKAAGFDAYIGGNIGTAVFLLPAPLAGRIYVLELSSYQIDLMPELKPDVGILMNLSPDHLDRHGTMANYASVKARMFARQAEGATAIVSVDDAWCTAIADKIAPPVDLVRMSVELRTDAGVSAIDGRLVDQHFGPSGTEIDLNDMRSLRGSHNWQNACAAYAAARAMGADAAAIETGLRSFPGLAHRMEQVAQRGSVVFVNDSKATNSDAAARALSSFDRIYWIAGGLAKSGGIDDLAVYFPKLAHVYLIGDAADAFARTLDGKAEISICGTIERAVSMAAQDAKAASGAEAAVLLSPACASFDQYANFEIRGEAFREAVLALEGIELPAGGDVRC